MTTPIGEMFDDVYAEEGLTQEETLMNEREILSGLLDLAKSRKDPSRYRRVDIKRDGVVKVSFRIRPLSEEEANNCYKNATKYSRPKKAGDPKVALETDVVRARSLRIYAATVDEDRAKVWDNKDAMRALDLLDGADMIDIVLDAGEKDAVCDLIEEISGFSVSLEEQAKN
jgi:hypothetical protein